VRARALGTLTGNWIFVGKQVPYPHLIWAEVQIWAIPLEAGAPRIAFAYDVSLGGAPEAIFDNAPRLRRQFSPDGVRVVVSVNGGLFVVELTTGQVRPLGMTGYFPAWSKDGSQIAFLSYLPVEQVVPPEQAIFVVAASGGAAREIARVGYLGQSVEWSPDGSTVIVATKEGIAIVDVGSGRVLRRLSDLASHVSFANWRAATPQIAIATGCNQTSTTKLIVLDDARAPERTLLDTGERCPALTVQDPRWNPASLDELLYVAARANAGAMPHEYRAHVLNVRSGREATLPLDAYEATWTWQGDAVAYLRRAATGFYGDSVRVWRRDGSSERVLLIDTENPSLFGISSLRY
jgi:dipeptidyl aminopeptidase/acylaminoacyl peptidase